MALSPLAWRPVARGGSIRDTTGSLRVRDLQPGGLPKSPVDTLLPAAKPLQPSQTQLEGHAPTTALETSLEVSPILPSGLSHQGNSTSRDTRVWGTQGHVLECSEQCYL